MKRRFRENGVPFLLGISIFFVMTAKGQERNNPLQDADQGEYRIIHKDKRSGLSAFAKWFHQDWRIQSSGFPDHAASFLESLNPDERQKLKLEIRTFIASHAENDVDEIRRAWIRLGAEAWPFGDSVKSTLESFAESL